MCVLSLKKELYVSKFGLKIHYAMYYKQSYCRKDKGLMNIKCTDANALTDLQFHIL